MANQNDTTAAAEPALLFRFVYFWSCPLYDEDDDLVIELEISKEMNSIERLVKTSKLNISLDFFLATSFDFHVKATCCDILHFNMHGEDGSLGFEKYSSSSLSEQIGSMDDHTIADLTKVVKKFNPTIIFLGTCHSQQIAEAFVKEAGVSHVIAIKEPVEHGEEGEIDDDAATLFTKAFYSCLFQSKHTIQESFDNAVEVTEREYPTEADKFILLGSGSHDVHIELPPQGGEMIITKSPEPATGNLRRHTTEMVGRGNTVGEIVRALHRESTKVTVVVGEPNVGKTEVALWALNHCRLRGNFDTYLEVESDIMNQMIVKNQEELPLLLIQSLCEYYDIQTQDLSFSILVKNFASKCSQNLVVMLDGFDFGCHFVCQFIDRIVRIPDKNIKVVLTTSAVCPSEDASKFSWVKIRVNKVTNREAKLIFRLHNETIESLPQVCISKLNVNLILTLIFRCLNLMAT